MRIASVINKPCIPQVNTHTQCVCGSKNKTLWLRGWQLIAATAVDKMHASG